MITRLTFAGLIVALVSCTEIHLVHFLTAASECLSVSVLHVSKWIVWAVKVNAISIQRQGEDHGGAVVNVENSDESIMYAADTLAIMTAALVWPYPYPCRIWLHFCLRKEHSCVWTKKRQNIINLFFIKTAFLLCYYYNQYRLSAPESIHTH